MDVRGKLRPSKRNQQRARFVASSISRCCKACKAHGANRFYRTKRAANKGRAHPGCNCAIVTQTIDRALAKQYFKGRKKVYDLRSEVT